MSGAYAAADLPIWQANFGNGGQAAPALATAGLVYSRAAETVEAATASKALIKPDQSLESDLFHSGVIDVATSHGPWWLVVENGQFASPNSRSVINKPAAAFDAAMAEWAPRRRSSIVADDFSAAVAANDHGSEERFAALNRPGSAQRRASLRHHMRLTFGDEVVKSLD